MDLGSGAKDGPPIIRSGEIAPAFSSKAWWRGWEADLTLDQFKGQYIAIFFDSINMELEQLEVLSDRINEFQHFETQAMLCTCD